jgi:hypothetical protein
VVSGDYVHGTANRAALKDGKGALGDCAGYALIIEHVASDKDEVSLMFRGALEELLDRLESGLADAVARAFIESRYPQS